LFTMQKIKRRARVSEWISSTKMKAPREKIFNHDVCGHFGQVRCPYKKYLAVSLLFVVVITGATLSVPYISKIIIDRLIVKQGSIVNITSARFYKR